MSSLPLEIIENILYRVPAKTIGRCRCVSKAWLDLLTQPHFTKYHLKQTKKHATHSPLLISASKAFFSIPLSTCQPLDETPSWATRLNIPIKPHDWNRVFASCDGLVLFDDYKCKTWLINPTTRATRAVPRFKQDLPVKGDYTVLNSTIYGLGYDSFADDYKVVQFSSNIPLKNYDVDCSGIYVSIFSVKTGAWRKPDSSPYYGAFGLVSPNIVFVDGRYHCIASETTNYTAGIIVAFSLHDENFYEVPPPSSFDGKELEFRTVGVLGGCLCVFQENDCDVWVMKEYGVQESWTKFTIVNPNGSGFKPLCLFGAGLVVLTKEPEIRTGDEKLAIYDIKEGTMKEVVVNGIPRDYYTGVIYVESLVSPNYWSHEV